jgi:fibronectin-binding autotransporter adhesin
MALPILDGNQSATTLSSILTSGEHIPAHTVVSLGTQAITDISGAVSGSVVSISNFPATQTIAGTVTANVAGNFNGTIENYDTDGEVTHKVAVQIYDTNGQALGGGAPLPISGTVTVGNTVTIAGTVTANPTGTQTIAGTVTIGAGTAQIGSVTASIGLNSVGPSVIADSGFSLSTRGMMVVGGISTSDVGSDNEYRELKITNTGEALVRGTVTVGNSVTTVGNSVTIGSLPAISGTVTANLSISSTVITSGSFSSLASATLVPGNTARKMATVYNLGAGQLFVNAGATATTLGGGFMVALSSGDFYECDYTTTTLSAIFATAGTASWMSH